MCIRVVKYNDSYKEDWDAFVENAKNRHFMFFRDYMEYHNDRYFDYSLLFYDDRDRLLALLVCNKKANKLISHEGLTYGGIIVDDSMRQSVMMNCINELINHCISNKIDSIKYKALPHMYHVQPAEEDRYALFFNNAKLEKVEAATVVDLDNPIKMSKLRRRQINKSKKEKVEVVIENSLVMYSDFINLQNQVLMKRHNTIAVHTGKEIYNLHKRFPNNIKLYVAKKNGEIIAGSIVFICDEVVHTQYLCANDDARHIGALDLTIDTIINEYSGKKKWLDFGRSTENEGYYLNEGLINQKEGFGGRTMVYETYMLKIATRNATGGVIYNFRKITLAHMVMEVA